MGPWSRSFLAAVVGNADRPDLEVTDLWIEAGKIAATVGDCEVTLTTAVIAPRTWSAMTRYAQGMGQLEEAVAGRVQSVHLEHLLEEDWGELLVPRTSAILRRCTCHAGASCEHVASVAHAFADQIEDAPRVLLRWRGVAQLAVVASGSPDPWQGKNLRVTGCARAIPTYAVLKRLGCNEVPTSGNQGLAETLRPAYRALVDADD
jgi:uncharacterized Zn finger protein